MNQRELLHNQPAAGRQYFCTLWHRASDRSSILPSLTHQLHPKEMLLRNKRRRKYITEGAEILGMVLSSLFYTSLEVTCNKTLPQTPGDSKTQAEVSSSSEEGSEVRAGNHCTQKREPMGLHWDKKSGSVEGNTQTQGLWKTKPLQPRILLLKS